MAIETDQVGRARFNFVDRDLIRACVHCGMCLSYCPTYKILGSELDSPRGRIYQMRLLHDGKITVEEPSFQLHIDRCLNCRACETACPSGVQYGQLLEATRAVIPPKSDTERLLKDVVLNRVFTTPLLLEALGMGMRFYQKSGLQAVARATGLLNRLPMNLGKLEGLLPPFQGGVVKARLPETVPARGATRYRVALITGCVQDQFFSLTNAATARVLAINGCEVVVPRGQACCGALHTHGGQRDTARSLARRNIATFEQTGADYYIINAAGCGSTLKEYHHLLADDQRWAERAHQFSSRVRDISEFLASVELNRDFGEVRRRITYQDACHLVHGQKISAQPRELLQMIPGIELVEMKEADTCCGSAGIYNVTQFDLSMQLLERKVDNLAATNAQMVVAGNPGCLIQLAHGVRQRGLRVETMHIVDLLDLAYRARSR
ncbi:MAG TPA: heterodisulfide reductase-related iron-sulfur binding cluster [Chloroflexota bacterium]|nr:heterodisulfide reductase-related iron-sulfur binding cluster [Chloroflexota bacterium]